MFLWLSFSWFPSSRSHVCACRITVRDRAPSLACSPAVPAGTVVLSTLATTYRPGAPEYSAVNTLDRVVDAIGSFLVTVYPTSPPARGASSVSPDGRSSSGWPV